MLQQPWAQAWFVLRFPNTEVATSTPAKGQANKRGHLFQARFYKTLGQSGARLQSMRLNITLERKFTDQANDLMTGWIFCFRHARMFNEALTPLQASRGSVPLQRSGRWGRAFPPPPGQQRRCGPRAARVPPHRADFHLSAGTKLHPKRAACTFRITLSTWPCHSYQRQLWLQSKWL